MDPPELDRLKDSKGAIRSKHKIWCLDVACLMTHTNVEMGRPKRGSYERTQHGISRGAGFDA